MTRKITRGVAAIELGYQDEIFLGNLDAVRDWGHARDYAEGMWRIVQHSVPDDFVLATGKTCSVRQFVEKAFAQSGREIVWDGTGTDEVGHEAATGTVRVRIDPAYFRPTEVETLCGDYSKAKRELGWEPTTSMDDMVVEMVAADLKRVAEERGRIDRHG